MLPWLLTTPACPSLAARLAGVVAPVTGHPVAAVAAAAGAVVGIGAVLARRRRSRAHLGPLE